MREADLLASPQQELNFHMVYIYILLLVLHPSLELV